MTQIEPRPRQTRNTERTRRAVLDAAAHLMGEQGTAVSLADVAAEAGVSKSGLLHHFATREQLVLEVVQDANEQFRSFVIAHLDLSENVPGKLLRAYVRALTETPNDFSSYFASSPLWNGVHRFAGVQEAMERDGEWWAEQLCADGLDAERVHIIRRAAEGLASAASYEDEPAERLERMRTILLAMTRQTGAIAEA